MHIKHTHILILNNYLPNKYIIKLHNVNNYLHRVRNRFLIKFITKISRLNRKLTK